MTEPWMTYSLSAASAWLRRLCRIHGWLGGTCPAGHICWRWFSRRKLPAATQSAGGSTIRCMSQVTHEACRGERTRERGYLPASERVPMTATVAVAVLLILRWAIVLCLAAPLRVEKVMVRATGESSLSMLMAVGSGWRRLSDVAGSGLARHACRMRGGAPLGWSRAPPPRQSDSRFKRNRTLGHAKCTVPGQGP